MPEVKKTSTAKPTSTTKRTSTSASAERARKEALRAEVLSVYSKKQNYNATTERSNDDTLTSPQIESQAPTRQNTYSTPFFSSNSTETPVSSEVHVEEIASGEAEPIETNEDDKQVPQGKSFAEFSKENYGTQEGDNGAEFAPQNYAGFNQKQTAPTRIIKEKKYSRSPSAEKFARFISYLFTTKEGWYYILGTLCLIFIIVLFFI